METPGIRARQMPEAPILTHAASRPTHSPKLPKSHKGREAEAAWLDHRDARGDDARTTKARSAAKGAKHKGREAEAAWLDHRDARGDEGREGVAAGGGVGLGGAAGRWAGGARPKAMLKGRRWALGAAQSWLVADRAAGRLARRTRFQYVFDMGAGWARGAAAPCRCW